MANSDYNKDMSAIFTGVMDMDSDPRTVKGGNFRSIVNGTIDIDADGGANIVKYVKSSLEIADLGRDWHLLKIKEFRGLAYALFFDDSDSNGYTRMVSISKTGIVTDYFAYPLGNSPSTVVNYMDFVQDKRTGDILCYWLDGENQPLMANISRLQSGFTPTSIYDFYVAKRVPEEPDITPRKDYSLGDSWITKSAFQFATRWIYKDGETTPLSTYSKTAFKPDGLFTSKTRAASKGVYVDDGYVYTFDGVYGSSKTILSSGYDTSYDRIVGSGSLDILVMFSSTSSMPIMVSNNGGSSFKEIHVENDPSGAYKCYDGTISEDGKYFYLAISGGVLKSADYGETMELLDNIPDLFTVSNIRCSSDGSVVVRSFGGSVLFNIVGFDVKGNYGESHVHVKAIANTEGSSWVCSCGVSESGRSIVASLNSSTFVSTNYGDTFATYESRDIMRAISIYDSGFGFADGFVTNDFYANVSAVTSMTGANWIHALNSMVVVQTGGRTYTVNLDGHIDEVPNVSQNIQAFSESVSIRTLSSGMSNYYNVIDISIDEPNDLVDSIEVYAIDINSGTAYMVKRLDVDEISFVEGKHEFSFYNNSIYRVLSSEEKSVLFSNVPLSANHQRIVGDRLLYMNYRDGRNFGDIDFSVSVSYSDFDTRQLSSTILSSGDLRIRESSYDLPYVFSRFSEGNSLSFSFTCIDSNGNTISDDFVYVGQGSTPNIGTLAGSIQSSLEGLIPGLTVSGGLNVLTFGISGGQFLNVSQAFVESNNLTLKKGFSAEYGIVYYDEMNRGSYPQFSNGGVTISDNINKPLAYPVVTINSMAPSWAVKYKFVRVDRALSYYTIPGFQYSKALDGNIYLMKYSEDSFLPDVGTSLEVHDPSGKLISMPVIWRGTKVADFVKGAPAGEWVAVSPPSYGAFSYDKVLSGMSPFSSSIFYVVSKYTTEDNVLFFEVPGEYKIVNGYHMGSGLSIWGGDTGQTSSSPATIRLNDGNVFYAPGNNVELMKIDSTNNFYSCGRPMINIDGVTEVDRYDGYTFSGKYVDDASANGLSMFNENIGNYGTVLSDGGSIGAIISTRGAVYVFQEKSVGYFLVNKNILTTPSGDGTVTQSSEFLSSYTEFAGEHGCINPESLCVSGGMVYFIDKSRGNISRVAGDGITVIGRRGIGAFSRKFVNNNDTFFGHVDPRDGSYWIHGNNDEVMLRYSEIRKGWVSIVAVPELDGIVVVDDSVLTVTNGAVHKLRAGAGYGTIHGTNVPLNISTVINSDPAANWVYNSISLRCNRALDVSLSFEETLFSDNDASSASISASKFELRESMFKAKVPNIEGDSIQYTSGRSIPLGIVSGVSGNIVELETPFHGSLHTTDFKLFSSDGGPMIEEGDVSGIVDGNIELASSPATSSLTGRFVLLIENSYINGHELRAPFINVSASYSGNEAVNLFLITVNATKSNE